MMRSPAVAAVVLFALLVGACAQSASTDEEPAAAQSATSTSTTTEPITTTAAPTTSTTSPTTTSSTLLTGPTTRSADGAVLITNDVPFTSLLTLDVLAPETPGNYPVVVVFHGGGWVGGNPDDMAPPLAEAIAEAGAVVFNAPYRLALRGGGYPMTFEDAACAVRFARYFASGFGGDPGFVTVVGYSAGARRSNHRPNRRFIHRRLRR